MSRKNNSGQSIPSRQERIDNGRCPVHGLAFNVVSSDHFLGAFPYNDKYSNYHSLLLKCPRQDCGVHATVCHIENPNINLDDLKELYEIYRMSHFKNKNDISAKDKNRIDQISKSLSFSLQYSYIHLLDKANDYRIGRYDYRPRNMKAIYKDKKIKKIENIWYFHLQAQKHILQFVNLLPFIVYDSNDTSIHGDKGLNTVKSSYYAFDVSYAINIPEVRNILSENDIYILEDYYTRSLDSSPHLKNRDGIRVAHAPEGFSEIEYFELQDKITRYYKTETDVAIEYLSVTALEQKLIKYLWKYLQETIDLYVKSLYPSQLFYNHISTLKI